MERIEAKTIIKQQYYILHRGNKKVGEVSNTPQGYEVKINGTTAGHFKSFNALANSEMFKFTDVISNRSQNDLVHGFITDGTAYNAVWNTKYKLPLFTKEEDSKSWCAAGWYYIQVKGKRKVEFCPKLITLQRNQYEGPFNKEPELIFDKLFQ